MHVIVLPIHIAAGTFSVLTGAAALLLRKGGRAHRTAGSVFIFAMIIMGATAAALGRDIGNTLAGGMTIYMVTTGWMAGRRRDKQAGLFEVGAFTIAIVCGIGLTVGAVLLAIGVRKADNPFITPVSFLVSGAVMLAAAGDLSVVIRRGLSGAQRMARHLWRMCFALFIAAGSFTAQGANVLPHGLPRQQLLLGAVSLVLGVMFYWLARVLVAGWKPRAMRPS